MDHYTLDSIISYTRDKLNAYLEGRYRRVDGAAPRRGWSVVPKVKYLGVRDKIIPLIENKDDAKKFWDRNKKELRIWVLKFEKGE